MSTERLGDIGSDRVTHVGQGYTTRQGNLGRACLCNVRDT